MFWSFHAVTALRLVPACHATESLQKINRKNDSLFSGESLTTELGDLLPKGRL
jgi:hypothetical protein